MPVGWRRGLAAILCLISMTLPAGAAEFRLGVYDSDDDYIAGVMRLALKAEGGNHSLQVIEHHVPQNRALRDLDDGTAPYNVFFSGYDPEREQELRMVAVPLTRGLLGYRLLAVRAADAPLFANIHSLQELTATVTVGAGASWPDTPIMAAAGFRVVTGPDESLWPMLKRGRFTAFPRGLNEIAPELQRANTSLSDNFVAVPNLMIAYRYDSFFYVANQDEELARILEIGLAAAYADGSFMAHFKGHPDIAASLQEMAAHRRTIFWLDNPLLGERIRSIPDFYWQDFSPAGAAAD
ncbi:MAG: hypothetical protein EP335_00510 [Alphaproteobacteria bacterium]|nr:MAG: hypothetical protein EP335_00510 [Alphaproteobacteria bacterium]